MNDSQMPSVENGEPNIIFPYAAWEAMQQEYAEKFAACDNERKELWKIVDSMKDRAENGEPCGSVQEWKDRAEKAEESAAHYQGIAAATSKKLTEYIDKTREAEAEVRRLIQTFDILSNVACIEGKEHDAIVRIRAILWEVLQKASKEVKP